MVERLTYLQLAELSLASLRNARKLHEDAMVLLDAKRPSGAYLLLGLSLDELGKHIIVSALPTRPDTDEVWKSFWKKFRTHERKLDTALLFEWLGDVLNLDAPIDAKSFHQLRLGVTYVDLRQGEVSSPENLVNSNETRVLGAKVNRLLASHERIFGPHFTAEKLARTMSKLAENPKRRLEGNLHDPKALLELLKQQLWFHFGVDVEAIDSRIRGRNER